MNKNSIAAYFDKENKRTFKSHAAKIVRELYRQPSQHSYQLASKLKLSNESIKKRLADLKNEGIVEFCGNTGYYGNTQSLYKLCDQLKMFKVNKIGLRKWLELNHPDIIFEYEALIKNEL